MTQARFRITHAGPHVTIQDRGRFGLMRFGLSASGPMDRGAALRAGLALGVAADSPLIEISRGGLALECTEGQVSFALTGGGFQVNCDGTALPSWVVASISAGQKLVIRPGHWGSWAYLAFAGALVCKTWLGSSATHAPSGLGAGKLQTGADLVVEAAEVRSDRHREIPCPVSSRPRRHIRVVLGPQDRFFAPEDVESLLSAPFVLTESYDRMGVRLSGPLLVPASPLDMPSEPIVRGSIQVAGDGVATVLLADHQTTGGYPKIATILSDDLDGFVQLRPKDAILFAAISPEAAIAAHRTRRTNLARNLMPGQDR